MYPQETERDGGGVWRQKGDSRRKGNSVYWEKERLKDIDVGRQKRDEQRQLTMERTLLALKREGGGGGWAMEQGNDESLRGGLKSQREEKGQRGQKKHLKVKERNRGAEIQ